MFIGNSADVKCDKMKTVALVIGGIFSFILLLLCIFCIVDTTFFCDLNPIKLYFSNDSAKDWKIPKGYAILYSQCDQKYMGKIPQDGFCGPDRLEIFHEPIPVDLWANYPEDASHFSDSIKCKYYLKMYFDRRKTQSDNKRKIDSINNCYKPLTK